MPVHTDDLAQSITTASEKIDEVKGNRYLVNGSEEHTIYDILAACEKAAGKPNAKPMLYLGVTDLVEEWFSGIAHDKNLAKMAKFYETYRPDLKNNDFMTEMDLKHSQTFSDFYAKLGRVREEDYVHPLFSDYKKVSMD